jgi:glucose-1-phosphate cytidylyltransferase
MAYRHAGFWSCMDTYKDNLELNEQWAQGQAPWKIWA